MGAAMAGVESKELAWLFGGMRYMNIAVKYWTIAVGVGYDKSLRQSKNAI